MPHNEKSVGFGVKQTQGTILALSLCGLRQVSKLLWASASLAQKRG